MTNTSHIPPQDDFQNHTAEQDAAFSYEAAQEPSNTSDDVISVAIAALQAELDQARADMESYKEQWIRTTAEMENLRKRTEREVDDTRKFAISNFAKELIPVCDNLFRAAESASAQQRTENQTLDVYVQGIEMTMLELVQVLERFHIKRLYPVGELFNPNLHQAVAQVEDATQPANHIVQIVQAGYSLQERLLKPALVVVSKGSPHAASQSETGQPATGDGSHVDTQA